MLFPRRFNERFIDLFIRHSWSVSILRTLEDENGAEREL